MKAVTIAALAALAAASPAAPDSQQVALAQLHAADARLAAVHFRLVTANADLCRTLMPVTGARFNTLAQYAPVVRAAARARYGFAAPQAVQLVVPASPAEGQLQSGDAVRAINGVAEPAAMPAADAPASNAARDALRGRIAVLPPATPIAFAITRAGTPMTVSLTPRPGCRAEIEVTFDQDSYSLEDGTLAISADVLRRFDENGVAVVIAHELAHVILRTQARLDAAGVKTGMFVGELGRNARLRKQGELEADRLAVALLYNAGYPPGLAAEFFAGPGKAIDYGLLRDRGTPSRSERVAATRAEAALITPGTPRPYLPAMLAARDQKME